MTHAETKTKRRGRSDRRASASRAKQSGPTLDDYRAMKKRLHHEAVKERRKE